MAQSPAAEKLPGEISVGFEIETDTPPAAPPPTGVNASEEPIEDVTTETPPEETPPEETPPEETPPEETPPEETLEETPPEETPPPPPAETPKRIRDFDKFRNGENIDEERLAQEVIPAYRFAQDTLAILKTNKEARVAFYAAREQAGYQLNEEARAELNAWRAEQKKPVVQATPQVTADYALPADVAEQAKKLALQGRQAEAAEMIADAKVRAVASGLSAEFAAQKAQLDAEIQAIKEERARERAARNQAETLAQTTIEMKAVVAKFPEVVKMIRKPDGTDVFSFHDTRVAEAFNDRISKMSVSMPLTTIMRDAINDAEEAGWKRPARQAAPVAAAGKPVKGSSPPKPSAPPIKPKPKAPVAAAGEVAISFFGQ